MAAHLAGNASEGGSIVCYCTCSYPLCGLLPGQLEAHPTSDFQMLHFHLPLYAPQTIKKQHLGTWMNRLGNLHRAHWTLNYAEEIDQFEQSVNTSLNILQQTIDDARQKLKAMRNAYRDEVDQAVKETSSHAIDDWTPEPNSLSLLIRKSDGENFESLSAFMLEFALRHCDFDFSSAQSELARVQEGMKAMRQESTRLRDVEASRTRSAAPIVISLVEPLHNCVKVEYEPPEVAQKAESSVYIGKAEALQMRDSGPVVKLQFEALLPQFEQEARRKCLKLLEDEETLQAVGGKDNFPAGLGWTEALGAHLGQFEEAQSVLQGAGHSDPPNNAALQALSIEAALDFHRGLEEECVNTCQCILQNCDPRQSELYLTAVYFYANIVDYDQSNAAEQHEKIQKWAEMPQLSSDEFSSALKMGVQGKVAYNQKNYREAEYFFLQAQCLLEKLTPKPFYYAMSEFFLGRIYNEKGDRGKAQEFYESAEQVFAAGFSKSIWRAINLNWLGEASPKSKAISAKKKANELLHQYHQSSILYPENLAELAELHSGTRKLEINYREKAREAYCIHFPTDIKAMQNLIALGKCYSHQIKNIGKSKKCFLDAKEVLAREHPSSLDFAQSLVCLAKFYQRSGLGPEARKYAKEAIEVLAKLPKEEAKEELILAEDVLRNTWKRRLY